ncbi:uncharacterized protein L203_105700 [Cryptococcus depauperatus CBS 7841]|uniref:Uncharacterized protein n=1 Tax=Cryptococcus depauperatus CBS 7841 TaxID=1295531 RepID=A0A1E3IFA7_9TREE|nr:hypothetical protein L203_03576 [Cryptococcus depauperatus CBS 7841]
MNKSHHRRREGIGVWETEECLGGPSRPRRVAPRYKDPPRREENESTTDIRQRRPARSTSMLSVLPSFLLPFLSNTEAAPAPVPSPARSKHLQKSSASELTNILPSRTLVELDKRVQYPTNVQTPSVLPTEIHYVNETVLPYLLTQHDDGVWRKAEGGWFLYGRRIAQPTENSVLVQEDGNKVTTTDGNETISSVKPSFAVERTLPNGWGSSSNRTDLYKVPLISVASVIMAAVIVALILFYIITRRKRLRKQKRAKERLRRKALIAAGLTEDDINGSAAEAAFKEKLAELERKHRAKKKREGQMGFAKGKVKGWNERLTHIRRRKAKKEEENATIEVLHEDKPEEEDLAGTGATVESPVGSGIEVSPIATPIERLGNTSATTSSHVAEQSDHQSTAGETSANTHDPPLTAPTPYYPPAYRPASVESVPAALSTAPPAGPSHSCSPAGSGPSYTPTNLPMTRQGEKAVAPGYYPAPVTEDDEFALHFASQAEGKERLVDLPRTKSEGQRMIHVATDDKQALEKLWNAASAPESNEDFVERQGPTAPEVMVDEIGFELIENHSDHSSTSAMGRIGSADSVNSVFPPPPQLSARIAQFHNLDSLGPSAPPVLSNPSMDEHLIPSAPPLLDAEFESEDRQNGNSVNVFSVPSAPLFEDRIYENSHSISVTTSEPLEAQSSGSEAPTTRDLERLTGQEMEQEYRGESQNQTSASHSASSSRSGSVQGIYLPRYEP